MAFVADLEAWHYRTSIGIFVIRPLRSGRWGLRIGGELLGSYRTAAAAADDVYMCSTGYVPWDRRVTVEHPTDLSEWHPGLP